MFAGHYGVSFLVKKFEPRFPLWILFLAAQLPDLLWAVFVPLGIEHYRTSWRWPFSLDFVVHRPER